MSECYCDYDQPEVYRKRLQTARKQHKCYECSRAIKAGEQYEYVFSVFEGETWPAHTCRHCLALREYVRAHVPCMCWSHGNVHDDAMATAQEWSHQAPGLLFGAYRRKVLMDRALKASRA